MQRRVKNGMNDTYARVWMVGQMFEYTYAQACAKDQYVPFILSSSTETLSPLPPSPFKHPTEKGDEEDEEGAENCENQKKREQ